MNKIYLSIFVFLLALFTACDMTDPEPTGSGKKATVRISIDDGTQERTVRPSGVLQQADAWELWGAIQGENPALLAEFSNTDAAALTLITGVWNFTLKGYKGTALILTGNIAEQVIDQGTNYLRFTVVLATSAEGEGTTALTIRLPTASGVTEARVFKDRQLYTTIEPIDNTVVFEEAFNAGAYYFSFHLYKDETLYGIVSEAVQVGASLRSEKTYTLTNADLNIVYTITYHLWDEEAETDYYQYTDTVTLPTPTRPGYVFRGWYENAGLSGNAVPTIPSGSTSGNKDFYAKWTEMADTPDDLSLAEFLVWISANVEEEGAYSITLKADEAIAPTELSYGVDNVSIVIDGGTVERVISLNSVGSLFSVGSGVTLTLGNNVTLQGRSDNTTSLVRVNERGTLVMNAGAKVSGNTATASDSSAEGGGVYVSSSGMFTMNAGAKVSGNTITVSDSSAEGGGVYVDSGGTFEMRGGEITDNSVSGAYSSDDYFGVSGGGVYSNGTFTMRSGAISGNSVSVYSNSGDYFYARGGGVYSNGTFTMSSGAIRGNTASGTSDYSAPSVYGGGVYVESSGTFEMNGGEISDNSADFSGGVFISGTDIDGTYVGGIFTMRGGEISGNFAPYGGGGVSNGGTFEMSDGAISGNSAGPGGGVYNYGTFEMSGGEISNNTASIGGGVDVIAGTFTMSGSAKISNNTASIGGGVDVIAGTFTMSGSAKISGNTASATGGYSYTYGGGVSVYSSGTFEMKGGQITSNSAPYGGGVYVGSNGTFTMNAGAKVSGNTISATGNDYAYGGGVYVDSGGTFEMRDGEISDNTASSTDSSSISSGDYAYYASGGGVYVSNNGTFEMNGGKVSDNSASTTATANTFSDVYGGGVSNAGTFTMSGGEISGNTATAAGGDSSTSFGGGVFNSSNGTFEMSGGEISGNLVSSSAYSSSTAVGYGADGGGVNNFGTFTMSGGEISGNTASANSSSVSASGGGVNVYSGAFTMSGSAKISDNTASDYGGGVSILGTFTMSGGTISDNTASSIGGGVYVYGGTFTMEDGQISGNTASAAYAGGGGVCVVGGTFEMRDGEISRNTALNGGGIWMDSSGTFTKQSGGTIYGSNADSSLKNTATNGSSYGHAVYVDTSPAKKRNTTAGVGVTLNSRTSGSAGGWE
jgi:uncharacterized repeat protein (TIGR02543 family)